MLLQRDDDAINSFHWFSETTKEPEDDWLSHLNPVVLLIEMKKVNLISCYFTASCWILLIQSHCWFIGQTLQILYLCFCLTPIIIWHVYVNSGRFSIIFNADFLNFIYLHASYTGLKQQNILTHCTILLIHHISFIKSKLLGLNSLDCHILNHGQCDCFPLNMIWKFIFADAMIHIWTYLNQSYMDFWSDWTQNAEQWATMVIVCVV